MGITGIICEYNPFHLGHKKQFDLIRQKDPDGSIVCLMSGNFVQRGKPAIVNKMVRAEAAVKAGADLVLELPVTAALSSAEGFAYKGVAILCALCDQLCFGTETTKPHELINLAEALLSEKFREFLRTELDKGLSFPVARQAALEQMGLDATPLTQPNNILAVEYCKAILSQNNAMKPMPILREGDYHDTLADQQNPSATAVRKLMTDKEDWAAFVPAECVSALEQASLHHISYGEKAILTKLRSMTDAEFETLPYGSEGLWRKLMHAVRSKATLEEILEETKSKRYTRTRLDRMVMCAFLGITEKDLSASVPYVRVLAFNNKGRQILKEARKQGLFINIGERVDDPYQVLEDRCGTLYGLFSERPELPDQEQHYRVYYKKNAED